MAALVRLKLFKFPTIITPAEIQEEMKIRGINSEAYMSGAEDSSSLLNLPANFTGCNNSEIDFVRKQREDSPSLKEEHSPSLYKDRFSWS